MSRLSLRARLARYATGGLLAAFLAIAALASPTPAWAWGVDKEGVAAR